MDEFRKPLTVVVDSREKKALVFPKSVMVYDSLCGRPRRLLVSTVREKMEAGDYMLRGYEDVVRVERKGSYREVEGNMLTRDIERQVRAFKKLEGASVFKGLFLETRGTDEAMSLMLQLVKQFGVDVLWMPTGRSAGVKMEAGAMVLQYMVSCVLTHIKKGQS